MIVMFNLSFSIVTTEPVVGVEAGLGKIKLSSYVGEPAAYPVMDAALISAAAVKASIVDFFISIPLFIVEY